MIKSEHSHDSGFEDTTDNLEQNLGQYHEYLAYNNQLRESNLYQLQLQQYHAWMYYQQHENFENLQPSTVNKNNF